MTQKEYIPQSQKAMEAMLKEIYGYSDRLAKDCAAIIAGHGAYDKPQESDKYARIADPYHKNVHKKLAAAESLIAELVEALKACLKKGSKWHPCDNVVMNAQKILSTAAKMGYLTDTK